MREATPQEAANLKYLRGHDPRQAYADAAKLGLSEASAARALGVTREAVRQAAIRYRLSFVPMAGPKRRARTEELVMMGRKGGLDNGTIAKILGISTSTVSLTASRIGAPKVIKKQKSLRREQVSELAGKGLTVTEVAARLGIPASNVSMIKARYGILFHRDARFK